MPTLFTRHISLRTILFSLAILCLGGVLALYGAFQARHILAGPLITIISGEGGATTESTVTLSGTALNIASLSLNGRSIYTDDTGAFTETLVLPLGYTILTLTARDRYGRSHSLERVYVRTQESFINHS